MADVNGITPAIEELQKQLLNIEKIYQPTIVEKMTSIDLAKIYMPLTEIQLNLPPSFMTNTIPQFVHNLNVLNQNLQPQISNIALATLELASKFDNILPNIQEQLFQIKELHYKDFSENEICSLEEINNEIEQISNVTKSRKPLTWEQWLTIISFIGLVVQIIQAQLPNQQLEQLHQDMQTIIQLSIEETTRDENFQQQFLKNQENQIDLLKRHLELNQCDCSKRD